MTCQHPADKCLEVWTDERTVKVHCTECDNTIHTTHYLADQFARPKGKVEP